MIAAHERAGTVAIAAFALVVAMLHAVAATAQTGPAIELDPWYAQVGATVTVDGRNFGPASRCGPVEVIFDFGGSNPTVVRNGVQPATDGSFTTSFVVPNRPVGDYAVVAQQFQNECPFMARAFFDVLRFQVDPDSGPAGSTATASGAGFPDVEECGPVTLTFDGQFLRTVDTQDFPGDPFQAPFTVPNRPPGTYVVEAFQDGCGERRGTDTFTIPRPTPTEPPTPIPTDPPTEPPTGPDPTLAIDPDEGPIGTEATVEGTNFDNGVDVVIRFGDVDAATVPAGSVAGGAFTQDLEVPEGIPGGPTTVTACQRCGAANERAATTTFLVTPRLEVDPELGATGRVTLAQGDGFPATTQVTLTWEPGIGSTTVITDDAGLLRAHVLVFHRDRLGPRELVATVQDATETTVSAPYIVVPGTGQPRNFVARR